MPQSAIDDLVKAVPDQLVRDIVQDMRHGRSEPSGLAGPEEKSAARVRGSGWQKPVELGSPPGIKYVDQIAESFAARDRVEEIAEMVDTARKLKGAGEPG
jgi:hypothetical protein